MKCHELSLMHYKVWWWCWNFWYKIY